MVLDAYNHMAALPVYGCDAGRVVLLCVLPGSRLKGNTECLGTITAIALCNVARNLAKVVEVECLLGGRVIVASLSLCGVPGHEHLSPQLAHRAMAVRGVVEAQHAYQVESARWE